MDVNLLHFWLWLVTSMALLYFAFSPSQNMLSWHMFAGYSHARFSLTFMNIEGKEEPFNQWDYVPHTMLAFKERDVIVLLAFLERVHQLKLNGKVTIVHNGTSTELKVRGSRVDR
jgi:hypothetical protein